MKRRLVALLLCICALTLTVPVTAQAAESQLTPEQQQRNSEKVRLEKTRVYDGADLLSEEEEKALELTLYERGIKAETDILVVTTDNIEGKSDKQYLDDFQDVLYFEEETLAENAAFMLINMEERIVIIHGYGDGEFWLSNDRTEYILDWVYEDLADGAYYASAMTFSEQVVYYMNEDRGVTTEYLPGQDIGETYNGQTNYYKKTLKERYTAPEYIANVLKESAVACIVIGVVLSSILCLILASRDKSKNTVHAATYMDQTNSGFTAQRDDYLRTSVTKVRKPTQSSSGSSSGGGRSSGGGGRSSGGRSHSGGSRRF